MNSIFVAFGLAEKLQKWFTGLSGALLSIFPKIFYSLCTLIFSIMDILQVLIRKVAGLDRVWYTISDYQNVEGGLAQGGGTTGDIAYNLINNILLGESPILSNVFWSLIILGFILLFLTTLVAILRSEYATLDSKSSSKGKIIGQSLKAIASFAIVPIVAVFGMYLSGIILQAIDSATTMNSIPPGIESSQNLFKDETLNNGNKSYINYIFYFEYKIPTSSTPISGQIFTAAAYKANRIRFYSKFQENLSKPGVNGGLFDSSNQNISANLLDNCFANGYILKSPITLSSEPFKDDYLFPLGKGNPFFSNAAPEPFTQFDKNNVSLVWYYYDLFSFDFIVCLGALVVAAKILIDLVFGLMKRLFELVVLFLIAAPMASLMPLDDGAALTNWRKRFISKAIGTYAPILGLNLFFIVLPEFTRIQFFGIPILDTIANMILIIVGLLMIKDLVSMMAELVGGDDTLKSGSDLSGQVGSAAIKMGKTALMPLGAATKVAKGSARVAKFGSGVARNAKNHKAEKGYIAGSLNDEEIRDDLGGQTEKSYFDSLSGRQRKDFLTRARLNMSDDDRKKAQNFNAKAAKTTSSSNKFKPLKSSEMRNKQRLEGAAYHALTSPIAMRKGLWNKEESETFKSADYNTQRKMIKQKMKSFTKEDKQRILQPKEGSKDQYFADNATNKYKTWEKAGFENHAKIAQAKLSVKSAQNARYENFNARFFGAEGSQQRAESDARIQSRNTQERSQTWGELSKAGKEIADAIKNALSGLTEHLGGEFAKSWKEEGGGIKGLLASATGVSSKDLKFNEAIKEQTKLLRAQAAAQKILGGADSSAVKGSSEISLSTQSAEAIAKAITDQIKKP